MRVLDLDMDYFMTEIASTPFSCEERLMKSTMGIQYGLKRKFDNF